MQAETALKLAPHQAELDMVADNTRDKVLPQKDQYSAMATDRVVENKEDKVRSHQDLGLEVAGDIQAREFEGMVM